MISKEDPRFETVPEGEVVPCSLKCGWVREIGNPTSRIARSVTIGDWVTIGVGATIGDDAVICDGMKVGDGSIIRARTVLTYGELGTRIGGISIISNRGDSGTIVIPFDRVEYIGKRGPRPPDPEPEKIPPLPQPGPEDDWIQMVEVE